jgi:hypothetical protein
MRTMEPLSNPTPTSHQPTLAELLRRLLDDFGQLIKAEALLIKADVTKTLKLSFALLIVLMASGLLLALMLSLLLAALVVALRGTPVQALVAAAFGNGLIACTGIAWLSVQLRKAAGTQTEDTSKLVPGSERGDLPS